VEVVLVLTTVLAFLCVLLWLFRCARRRRRWVVQRREKEAAAAAQEDVDVEAPKEHAPVRWELQAAPPRPRRGSSYLP
jgi:hypothetical protein